MFELSSSLERVKSSFVFFQFMGHGCGKGTCSRKSQFLPASRRLNQVIAKTCDAFFPGFMAPIERPEKVLGHLPRSSKLRKLNLGIRVERLRPSIAFRLFISGWRGGLFRCRFCNSEIGSLVCIPEGRLNA
jgi:hypothetical protein